MGIVVDFPQSTIDVEHDQNVLDNLKPFFEGLDRNRVTFPMMSFETKFVFRFDPNSHSFPPSNQSGSCQIGIVQNVLYARLLVKYSDGSKKDMKQTNTSIDCGNPAAFPFYNIAGSVTRRTPKGPDAKNIFPYRSITYNKHGFGELLDPYKPAGDDIILQSSSEVTHLDQPYFKVKLRSRSNAVISEATQILTFGIWLVAVPYDSKKQAHVFAHADVFSLLYSAKLSTRGQQLLTIGTPDWTFKVRAMKGRMNTPEQFTSSPGLRISAGAGSVHPMLKGKTAQEADKQWENTLLSM